MTQTFFKQMTEKADRFIECQSQDAALIAMLTPSSERKSKTILRVVFRPIISRAINASLK